MNFGVCTLESQIDTDYKVKLMQVMKWKYLKKLAINLIFIKKTVQSSIAEILI